MQEDEAGAPSREEGCNYIQVGGYVAVWRTKTEVENNDDKPKKIVAGFNVIHLPWYLAEVHEFLLWT